jgi:hypothetical protein
MKMFADLKVSSAYEKRFQNSTEKTLRGFVNIIYGSINSLVLHFYTCILNSNEVMSCLWKGRNSGWMKVRCYREERTTVIVMV